jgi:chemotaxis protein MotB
MARLHKLVGFALLSLATAGCVTQEKYAALKLERDQLAGRLSDAEGKVDGAMRESEILKNQLAAIQNGKDSNAALSANQAMQIAELQKQLEDANRRYSEAMSKVGQMGTQLSPALTNELSAFAQANPDLVEFDAAKGVVKFKSDVTFAPGSAQVTEKAKDVIGRFSTILNSPAASGYELMVAGHTDNTRVSNPATISAGHKDNWYLSAHRAIGVAAELFNHSVSSNRLSVAGYADQRPVAANTSEAGRAQNRRVEVLILPTTVRGSSSTSGFAAEKPAAKKAAPALNISKDSAADARPTAPVMNK